MCLSPPEPTMVTRSGHSSDTAVERFVSQVDYMILQHQQVELFSDLYVVYEQLLGDFPDELKRR